MFRNEPSVLAKEKSVEEEKLKETKRLYTGFVPVTVFLCNSEFSISIPL